MNHNAGVMRGVAIGIIMDRRAGEALLKFPWLDEDYRSDWVRIAQPLAGDSRGQFFMPEVGDEVVVAFDQGDFDCPYVIGCLWNGVYAPPETAVENRVIKTPGGHTLRFEDGTPKKIILKSNGGATITLSDAPPGEKITIETPGGQKIELSDAPASITLTGGGRSLALSGGMVTIG